jgi:tetratricopeptide (TPR) repeat protein
MAATWLLILLSLHTGRREIMVGFHLGVSPLEYARTELNVMAHYLRLAFWPDDLCLDYYDWPIATHWSDISWGGWVVLGIAVATALALKYAPRWGYPGFWFFLILAPTSSILPIKREAAAEQRMYLPLVAVVVLAVILAWYGLRRWKGALIAGGICGWLLVALLIRLTIARNDQYSTTLEIWSDTVTKRPNNTRARIDLALAWAEASAFSKEGSPDAVYAATQAAQQFRIVLAEEPKFSKAVEGLGQSLEHIGQPRAAEDLYTRSLADHPDIEPELLVDRGILRARRSDWEEARADFLSAIQLNPQDAGPHYYLGAIDERQGDWKAAVTEYEAALRISPKYKDAGERLEIAKRRMASATEPSSAPASEVGR